MKVIELLNHKSKWTQGCLARNIEGCSVSPRRTAAVCWCLVGAVDRCYPYLEQYFIRKRIIDELQRITISSWNDSTLTTFEDVKALVKKLDI